MPILPIDIQTMLSQLDHVGKEQAAQREVSSHAQSIQASELVRDARQSDHSVNQPRELGEGPETVQEKQEQDRKRKRPGEKKKPSGDRQADAEVFEDPALGRHIDLTG